jgi:hypothetical protein
MEAETGAQLLMALYGNMLFYHKGLRVRKRPFSFAACVRKAAIPSAQIGSAH